MMTTNRPRAIFRAPTALASAIVLLGLVPGLASSKETLRWKFKEGQVLHYVLEQTTVQSGKDDAGQDQKQTSSLTMDMTWTIKAVDASGVATIHQTIDRLRTTAILPFGKFSFDSKEAGNAPGAAAPMFKVLLGSEFTTRMNPKGEVVEIKLSEKTQALLKGENDPMMAQGPFSEDGLKNMVAQMVTPLAEEGVDAGQSWKRSIAIPAGPNGQTRPIEQTFTYKGKSTDPAAAGLDAIEFTTKMEPAKADPNVPIAVKKETQAGRIDFDAPAGRIARSTTEETMEYSVSMQGKEVIQKAQISRVLTLSKDKAP